MGLLSNKQWLGGALTVVAAWLVLGACSGTPVAVVDDDAGSSEGGGGDATSDAGNDATVDGGSEGSSGHDGSSDGAMAMGEAGADASAESSTTQDASMDAPGTDAPSDASSEGSSDAANDVTSDAPIDSPADVASEAASDAPADAPLEAASCTFAGTWNMTVQTITAVPTFCQGVMDCTNCGNLFNATATQPTPSTIDWNADPGGVLCTAFSGSITPAGQFTTNETNCSPSGDGTTFDGQIDLSTCSMTATYVYVLTGCTITETMTGTQ